MNEILLIVASLAWWVCGSSAFFYYWYRDFGMPDRFELFFGLFIVGPFLGPLAWPVGKWAHGQD